MVKIGKLIEILQIIQSYDKHAEVNVDLDGDLAIHYNGIFSEADEDKIYNLGGILEDDFVWFGN